MKRCMQTMWIDLLVSALTTVLVLGTMTVLMWGCADDDGSVVDAGVLDAGHDASTDTDTDVDSDADTDSDADAGVDGGADGGVDRRNLG